MLQLQTPTRYYSREGLLTFLRETFPEHGNFRISQVQGVDGAFTFVAPRELTEVSHFM